MVTAGMRNSLFLSAGYRRRGRCDGMRATSRVGFATSRATPSGGAVALQEAFVAFFL
jgi:hypothetical protein